MTAHRNPRSMLFDDSTTPQWLHGELNPLAAAPGLPPAVGELIERHTSAFFGWRRAVAATRTAEADLSRVRDRDRLEAAAAVADGQPIQTGDTIEAAEKTLTEARRIEAAHKEGVAQIEQRIRAAMAAAGPTWLPQLKTECQAAHTAIGAALDQLAAALRRSTELEGTRTLVASPRGKWQKLVALDATEDTLIGRVREVIGYQPDTGARFDTSGGTNFREANTRAELDAAGF